MSKCETCNNHVHQSGMSKSLSTGKIFRNTLLERDGRAVTALSGCLYSGEIWECRAITTGGPQWYR